MTLAKPGRKTALVTGASAGIGLQLALTFARHGFDLITVARRKVELDALAQRCTREHGVQAHVFSMDLLAPGAPRQLVEALTEAGLTVDVLVNNAGLMDMGSFAEIDVERHERLLNLNVVVLTSLTRRLLPAMLERAHGRILNVASNSAFQPIPSMALYAASKAFVLSFTESLSEELRGSGVTATALCPGVTRTEMYHSAEANHDFIGRLPGAFLSEVEDVATEGYEACMAGRPVVVPGLPNRLLATGAQLAPRWLVRAIGGAVGRRNS